MKIGSPHGPGHPDEMINCFDANMNPVGVADRVTAHREGLWHRTLHIWLVNPAGGGGLFFQHRSERASSYPGLFDVSVAGHLLAGESPWQGFREIEEELGNRVPPESLIPIGTRTEASDLPDGQRNREQQLVYLAETGLLPRDCRPDPSEVQGVYLVTMRDVWALFDGEARVVEGLAVSLEGNWATRHLALTRAHLPPRVGNYYACVAIMAERMLLGQTPLAI